MPPANSPVEAETINTPPSEMSLHFSDLSLGDAEDNISERSTTPPIEFFDFDMLPPLPVAYRSLPYLHPRQLSHGQNDHPEALELVHDIDYTALNYVDEVDQNLFCPICRTPFSDPTMTNCGHVFCSPCLAEAVARNGNKCPTDRTNFNSEDPGFRIVRLLRNLVDDLLVECPACSTTIQRSALERHLSKVCPEARMACPGKYTDMCEYQILRKELTTVCLHFVTRCEECCESLPAISMRKHLDEDCFQRIKTCAECFEEYTHKDTPLHEAECLQKMTSCKWSLVGCEHVDRRHTLPQHEIGCTFRFVGHLCDELKSFKACREQERKEEATQRMGLEKRVRDLEARIEMLHRKNYTELVKHNPSESQLDLAVLAPELDHVATLLDNQKHRIDKVEAGLKEVEARSATLVINENLAIQNELIELRSLQQTTSMHVRWLLQFRLQENRRNRFGAGAGTGIGGNGGGSDNGGSSDSGAPIVPRRSSDSVHEPPRL